MKKVALSLIAVGALAIAGCSSTSSTNPFEQFLSNLSAAICATPASQQAALANIPLAFVTSAQAQQAVAAVCAGQFGTVQAPASAPGQAPALK